MKETQHCNENSFPWHMVDSKWNAIARDSDYSSWTLYEEKPGYNGTDGLWYSNTFNGFTSLTETAQRVIGVDMSKWNNVPWEESLMLRPGYQKNSAKIACEDVPSKGIIMQEQLMKYSPDTGEERPYPSNAKQWWEYHGRVAWLYNPWTGEKRDLLDIGSDVLGELIVPDKVIFFKAEGPCGVTPCQQETIEETSNTSYSGNDMYQNTNRYHGADVILVGGDPISRKHWDKVYGHLTTSSDKVTTVNPVRQILDDTEAMILEAVQSAERLLLGTTVVSYWVKFPLAAKVSSKLTREKETLVYVSGNTKTKYYCATENVAILAQSSIVLLNDDKAKMVEQTT